MHSIKALTFDLDDTLRAIAPVIIRAEAHLHAHLGEHFPKVHQTFKKEDLAKMRQQVVMDNPHLSHDLTSLRRMSFEAILAGSGYESHHSHSLMDRFFELRHDVEFYTDVFAALEMLAKHYRLYAISNGNADLDRLPIRNYFEGQLAASEAGMAKPDSRIFHMACDRLDLQAEDVLHIGDNPVDDIKGALDAGLKTAWINRTDASWEASFQPHITCTSLLELVDRLEIT